MPLGTVGSGLGPVCRSGVKVFPGNPWDPRGWTVACVCAASGVMGTNRRVDLGEDCAGGEVVFQT